jgi:hypothetical protein
MQHLDVLAGWGEQATDQHAALIDLVMGAVMQKLGEVRLTISPQDLAEFRRDYTVERMVTAEGGWSVRVSERVNPGQALLPEIVSDPA